MPSSSSTAPTPRPPLFLVLTLLTMWLLGMLSVAEGLRVIDIVRGPLSEALSSFEGADLGNAAQRAFVTGVAAHARVTLPLGVAQLVLGTVLAVVSVRALLWKRGSRSLALQLLAANALLTILHYLLHDPVRRAVVEALVVHLADQRPPDITPAQYAQATRSSLKWGFRLWLSAQLVAFGLTGFAMTRRSARPFLSGAEGSNRGRQG